MNTNETEKNKITNDDLLKSETDYSDFFQQLTDSEKEIISDFTKKMPEELKASALIHRDDSVVMSETILSESQNNKAIFDESKHVLDVITNKMKDLDPHDSRFDELNRYANQRIENDMDYAYKQSLLNTVKNVFHQIGGYALAYIGVYAISSIIANPNTAKTLANKVVKKK